MKKLLLSLGGGLAVFVFSVSFAFAAKPVDTCQYIKDGTIIDKFGDVIQLGYNDWGYNYQAHMFNGKYCDAYGDAGWCQQFKDVSLMMKWNDAWLGNKDCGTQGSDQGAYSSTTTPDTVLDRHYSSDSYIGSGAWLTNHATGTYTGSRWQLNGNYVMSFNYLGSLYVHDMTVTTAADGTFSGTGGYPSAGPYSITWTVNGTITDSNVTFHIAYDGSSYIVDAVGTIGVDGSLNGTWSNTTQSGAWTATSGLATKPQCEVSDFVKIVAAPADATMDGDNWVAADDTVIGPAIWGSFAIIQEQASDPCGDYDVMNYMSPLRKGLGNW